MASWRHLHSSSGSDGVDWTIEHDENARGRFRITYSELVSDAGDLRIQTRSVLKMDERVARKRNSMERFLS